MFVPLSKELDLLFAPLSWVILLGAVAAWRLGARPRLARGLLASALALLAALSLPLVSLRLYRALEGRAADTFRPSPPYDVVIVLGGIVSETAWRPGDPLELGPAADRIVRAAELLRSGDARQVLLSGGNVYPVPVAPPEAERLAGYLRAQGIAPGRIVVEGRSRNTRENALESAAVVASHPEWRRILLLTSAWHAPRALGCFRAVGLAPDLITVDHRGRAPVHLPWAPRAKALSDSTDALRELAGNLVYWAVGYSR